MRLKIKPKVIGLSYIVVLKIQYNLILTIETLVFNAYKFITSHYSGFFPSINYIQFQ